MQDRQYFQTHYGHMDKTNGFPSGDGEKTFGHPVWINPETVLLQSGQCQWDGIGIWLQVSCTFDCSLSSVTIDPQTFFHWWVLNKKVILPGRSKEPMDATVIPDRCRIIRCIFVPNICYILSRCFSMFSIFSQLSMVYTNNISNGLRSIDSQLVW